MSILQQTRPASKPSRKPLTVEMVITINGQAYHVEPIAPGPDNTKAFRMIKRGADEKVYDVCQTTAGLVECDCPSYEASFRGNGLETCKHGRTLIMCGLVDYPDFIAPADDARAAYDTAREKLAAIAESEATVRAEAERTAPAFDADFYRAQNAVAERRAVWVNHRHLHTSDPLPAPACCPADEPMPCQACVTHEGPGDLSDDGWDDGFRWVPSDDEPAAWTDPVDMRMWNPALDAEDDGPAARSLAEQVDDYARDLRAQGSPLGDLLAERAESLAAQIRLVEATTVEQFRDRLSAMLDCAADAAEAHMAAARCC